MIVASVSPLRFREALVLFFRDAPAHRREENLQWSLDRIATGEMKTDGLLCLYDGGAIAGSMFSQVFPDGYVSHWLPEVVGDNLEGEDMLLQDAMRRSEHAGGRIHQAMLDSDRRFRTDALLRNGFYHLTRVLNLVRFAGSSLPIPIRPDPVGAYRIVTPSLRQLAEVRELLPLTHSETLDCAEMNGLQSPDQILAGYRFSAPELSLWKAIESDCRLVGIMVVSRSADALELNYLGVLPEYRRRGLAAVLLAELVDVARLRSLGSISLNVDTRNRPARQLYESFGFEVAGIQEAFVKVVRQGIFEVGSGDPARL